MERVSIVEGKTPVIFVAPHGAAGDDTNTAIIAESAAEYMEGFAVINRGWKRGKTFDYTKEICDCNNLNHVCADDVPHDEFLNPIIRFKNRIRKKHPLAWIFTIHGMSNNVCLEAKDNSLSMIVGFGAGDPPSYTCQTWAKDLLIYQCQQHGWTTYEGKPGGKYSGHKSKNLVQYFRQIVWDTNVQAMQLEIIYDLRDSKAKAQLCGECLGDFIGEVINYNSWDRPKNFTTKQF